jgi:3-deoxy-D-manno-octulosonic-acid transferase
MLRRLYHSRIVTALGGTIAESYIRLVLRTSTVLRDPPDSAAKLFSQHPQIFAMWHGQFMMVPVIKPGTPADIAIIVSRHKDAEILANLLQRFGMRPVRGAGTGHRKKDRGGATALRGALRALKDGATFALTADVPPGPARRAGEGIVMLAKISGRPIVPCAMATNRYIAINSWSRFTFNLPFSKLAIIVGDPILVPRDAGPAELEAARLAVEQGINEVTKRAYALAGGKDPLAEATRDEAAKGSFTLWLYRAVTRLVAPLAPLILGWRERRGKEDKDRRPERYGEANVPRPPGFLAWFHAASVGEANAVLPVIAALAEARPQIGLLLTTGTVTSAKIAGDRLPPSAIHQYVPMDSPAYVERFLAHWRPDLAVFVESEIWPNLVLETKARDVPLVLINGRMSHPSFRSWRKRPGLSRPLFSAFDLVLAQNQTLAQRFAQLGATDAVSVGNLKIDGPPPPADAAAQQELASALQNRSVLLAASTHPGEEDIVVAAHIAMKKSRPDLITIILPRHPERGSELAKQLSGGTLGTALRSAGQLPEAGTDIYIADTIGEIGLFYTLAKVALVGGSLVARGGQNPVEAIKLGAAVLTGPNWQNFSDSYQELLRVKGCRQVFDSASLAEAALTLLEDEPARKTMQANAEAAIASMSGALDRTVLELERFLPPREPMRQVS